jgi:hypothetical protein
MSNPLFDNLTPSRVLKKSVEPRTGGPGIRKNRYSTTFSPFFNIPLEEI